MVKKKSSKKWSIFKSSQGHFLAVLILFAGFSLYAVASFFSSTNDYIDNVYVSVVGEGTEESVEAPQPLKQIFTDVDEGHRNAEAIKKLYHGGIIKGYDDGSFRPDSSVNRAELLTMLTNAVDADFSGVALENCFTDVNAEWFAVFVCYSKKEGWIKGFGDGSYKPNQSITKAEALKIILEAFDYELCASIDRPPYKDVAVDAWYAPYACAAKRDDIIDKDVFFSPSYVISRGELAQIIYNVMTRKEPVK